MRAAPDTIPVFVHAGSILLMGPRLQYTGEKPADPIELLIYGMADGEFTLYEDHGETYAYEHGAHLTITFTWKEASQTLTIGARYGSFSGMLKQPSVAIVTVGQNRGVGDSETANPDRVVHYDGTAQTIKLSN